MAVFSAGCPVTNPGLPDYIAGILKDKKKSVKELLKMNKTSDDKLEILLLQRWSCSQDKSICEPKVKCAEMELFASEMSPHRFGQAPMKPDTPVHFPPTAPETGHITQQHIQPPALHGQVALSTGVTMSLFHWQIQQEMQRMAGVSPELLNMQDGDGDTYVEFLHIAAAQGRRALAYVLAAKMAECGSLDVREHNGQTALHIAAAANQYLIVHDLLTHGAQINTRDLWGRTALHVCAEKGHYLSLQSIRKTQPDGDQQIDTECFNYDGMTPLHVAVLSHNAVVKEQRRLGNPSVDKAAELVQRRQTFVECVKTLLLMGASHRTKDQKSGRSCLHIASEGANVELMQLFLDHPSELSIVNDKTLSGNTALHIVSSLQSNKTQVQALKLLMQKGADPGSRNIENELPCQLVPQGPAGAKVRQILKGKNVHV
uniref:Nuclear factor of kappa light polypeptide gene enhancer in B-cells inhibitor, zeta n=2 Tax=Echeneis naucrates TaxID=173247 RepID=A0A665X492_ECHNA